VQASLGRSGLTYIEDAKLAALATRASVAARGTYYLCPLPRTQVGADQLQRLLAPVWAQQQTLTPVWRPAEREATEQEPELLAEGYEVTVPLEATLDGRPVHWPERGLVVRSVAWAQTQQRALETRLAKAQGERAALTDRRQGKKVYTEAAEVLAVGEPILAKYQVRGLLQLHCQTREQERPRRRYRARPARVEVERHVHLTARVDEAACEHAHRRLGWRVYATNHRAAQVSLAHAGLA